MKRSLALALMTLLITAAPSSAASDPKTQTMEIERGHWSVEDANFPHRKTFRLLCVDGLEFLSVEGYGGGQSTTTSIAVIQVMDKSGKPKTCK